MKHYPQATSDPNSRRWVWPYIAVGLVSLIWLGLRSGFKPYRLAYPCQQAAAAHALGFLTYLGALLSSVQTYARLRNLLKVKRVLISISLLIAVSLLNGSAAPSVAQVNPVLPTWHNPNAVSNVFAVTDVPVPSISLDGGTLPDGVSPAEALHDDGVDALINLMSTQGMPFYKTVYQPGGIFGRDDVIVIKVNAQWNCNSGSDNRRAHTNNDVVKGVIYRLVQHPEGFTGAVIIADNGQEVPAQLDCDDYNNAEDARQSYQDVANAFLNQGYDVCTYTWDNIRNNVVGEYDSGSLESGYVLVQDGTPGTDQLSYPKFQVTCGSHTYQLSMRYGLWNGTVYDNTHLKMINLPIVKRHGMAGATIAVKNYIGFLTTTARETRFGDFSEMHNFFWGFEGSSDYGLLGRQLALIRQADLNIVDAIWINPVDGWHEEDSAVRDNILLASTDPFAVDYYTSVYVLLPYMVPNSSEALNADARHHGGDFRGLLLTNEDRARLKGMTNMIDLDDSFTPDEELGQFNVFVADATKPLATLNISSQPNSQVIRPAQTAEYLLSITSNAGNPEAVTLSGQGAPNEVTISFDPNPVIPPATSQFRLISTPAVVSGVYSVTISGASTIASDTTTVNLIVITETTDFTVAASPSTRSAEPGQVATYTVSVNSLNNFDQAVTLAAFGLPAEIGTTWSNNPIAPDTSSILSLSVPPLFPLGYYGFSVVATASTQIRAEKLNLFIQGPYQTYLPIIYKGSQ